MGCDASPSLHDVSHAQQPTTPSLLSAHHLASKPQKLAQFRCRSELSAACKGHRCGKSAQCTRLQRFCCKGPSASVHVVGVEQCMQHLPLAPTVCRHLCKHLSLATKCQWSLAPCRVERRQWIERAVHAMLSCDKRQQSGQRQERTPSSHLFHVLANGVTKHTVRGIEKEKGGLTTL